MVSKTNETSVLNKVVIQLNSRAAPSWPTLLQLRKREMGLNVLSDAQAAWTGSTKNSSFKFNKTCMLLFLLSSVIKDNVKFDCSSKTVWRQLIISRQKRHEILFNEQLRICCLRWYAHPDGHCTIHYTIQMTQKEKAKYNRIETKT